MNSQILKTNQHCLALAGVGPLIAVAREWLKPGAARYDRAVVFFTGLV